MSKSKSKAEPEVETEEVTVEDMPAANSDEQEASGVQMQRVRELLFGRKSRQLETSLSALENKLLGEHQKLRAEVNERFDALESYLKSELNSLVESLDREEENRRSQDDKLGEQLREMHKEITEEANALQKRLEKSDREHREELLEARQRLSEELRNQGEELEEKLDEQSSRLSQGKADRSTMAALLTDMATRLVDDDEGEQ